MSTIASKTTSWHTLNLVSAAAKSAFSSASCLTLCIKRTLLANVHAHSPRMHSSCVCTVAVDTAASFCCLGHRLPVSRLPNTPRRAHSMETPSVTRRHGLFANRSCCLIVPAQEKKPDIMPSTQAMGATIATSGICFSFTPLPIRRCTKRAKRGESIRKEPLLVRQVLKLGLFRSHSSTQTSPPDSLSGGVMVTPDASEHPLARYRPMKTPVS